MCRGSHSESRIKPREFLPSGKITISQSSYKLGPRLRCQWPFQEHFRVEYTIKEHALPSAVKLADACTYITVSQWRANSQATVATERFGPACYVLLNIYEKLQRFAPAQVVLLVGLLSRCRI